MPRVDKGATGRFGEDEAARYLCQKGYSIVERNFRTRLGEIDIIASNNYYIVFAEVKTRLKGSMLLPREAVDKRKQRRIILATQMYLMCHDIGELQPRFDVVEVTTQSNLKIESINYIENAFTL